MRVEADRTATSLAPSAEGTRRFKSESSILSYYMSRGEFSRPEAVVANVARAEQLLRSNPVVVLRPNADGYEMRAIRDILRFRGYEVEAPERGFYHVIDQLIVKKAS